MVRYRSFAVVAAVLTALAGLTSLHWPRFGSSGVPTHRPKGPGPPPWGVAVVSECGQARF
jgi:hypothetical protein